MCMVLSLAVTSCAGCGFVRGLSGPASVAACSASLLSDAGDGSDVESSDVSSLGVVSIYRVASGVLTGLCFGEEDTELREAWRKLELFSTPESRESIRFLASFDYDPESEVLGFVQHSEDDGHAMLALASDAEESEGDRLATIAHEFTHVFAVTEDQIDQHVESEDACETYFDGDICFARGSLIADWTARFWTDDMLTDAGSDSRASASEGRCEQHPGFFGSYAATSPEEDFAESFSAMLLRIPPEDSGQRARLAWLEGRPELTIFRQLAITNDIGPYSNTFDTCG